MGVDVGVDTPPSFGQVVGEKKRPNSKFMHANKSSPPALAQ
jgi:hypothetical protein